MEPITSFNRKDTKFLSNFYPGFIEYEGLTFCAVEDAFQAAKTLDMKTREIFQFVDSPTHAHKLGRTLKLRPDWEEVKIPIMRQLLRQKFSDERLKAQLLATGDAELINGNTYGDRFWGIVRGEGRNELGKLLMELREELKKE